MYPKKKWLGMAAMLLGALSLSAFTPPFDGGQVNKDEKQFAYWFFADNKLAAGIGVFPSNIDNLNRLKVKCEDGELVVDTRELFNNNPGQPPAVTIRFYGTNIDNAVKMAAGKASSDRTNRMDYTMKGEPAGTQVNLLVEGEAGPAGAPAQHYWQCERFSLDGSMQSAYIDRVLPDDIRKLWARIDLTKPGVYTFEGVQLRQIDVPKPEFDPEKNYIVNGGAEQGWNSIMTSHLKQKLSTYNGKFIDFRNISIDEDATFTIDDKVKHSGKHSFCLESPKVNSNFDFRFAPARVVPGKPVTFTVWAKSAVPNTPIELVLFICSGHATGKVFIIGTEWTRCSYTIPAWGENHGDGFVIGDMASNPAVYVGTVTPSVNIRNAKGKIWVDDASWHVNTTSDFKEESRVWVRGELNKDTRYYFAGEKITADMELESADGKDVSGEFSYELVDIFGKTFYKSAVEKITLKGAEVLKKNVDVAVDSERRGPFHIRFTFKDPAGKTDSRTFYCGIIDQRPATLCRRIGVEVPGAQNADYIIPYLLDFGIGSIRTGGASAGQDVSMQQTPAFKKAGIDILFTTGLNHEGRDNPAKWDEYFANLAKWMDEFKGNVTFYETQNEPNIDGWTIEQNLRQIKQIVETVKKHDPTAKIAGPTPCSTDFTWIDSVLRMGGKDYLDVVTEHPYRKLPELPDYCDDSAAVRKLINIYNPKLQHFGTEAGNVHQPNLPDETVTPYERFAALADLRNMIQGAAGGADRYFHFAFSSWSMGAEWNCVYGSNPGNANMVRPNPMIFGYRNFANLIGDSKCVDRVKLGLSYRCHIFDTGKNRVAVMWKWRGEPTTITFDKNALANVGVYDFGGTPIKGEVLPLDEAPIYLRSEASAADLAKLIRSGKIKNTDGENISVSSVIRDNDKFALAVKNITGSPIDAKVTILNPAAIKGASEYELKDIAPESAKEIVLTSARPIDLKAQKIKVMTRVAGAPAPEKSVVELRGILVRKAPKAITIDGDLSDWPANAASVKLDRKDANDKTAAWKDAADKITAELRYSWDDNNFYTAVIVDKPDFFPAPDASKSEMLWWYDSVQTCFDTLRNGKPDAVQFDDDDFEYALGMMGGKPAVHRRWASSTAYDSLPKKQGLIDEVKLVVKRVPGKIIYEAAFPKRSVSPFKLVPYSTMKTCSIVNINDGKDRIGYLQLTPGVGDSKCPGKWMDIILLP